MDQQSDGDQAGPIVRPTVVRGTEVHPADERRGYREKIARITLDSMVQFVGLLDAEGTVLEINQVALDGVGVELSEVEKRPFWTTFWWQVSPEINATLREMIRRAARGEFVRWDAEIYGRASGKETIIIDASLMPVKDDDGTVVFICAEGRDITEKKAHEREIARQREELAQLDQLKTQFFANISHEFRTPLTLMLGPLEDALADAEALDAANRERLELTHRNSLRLLKLVNTLLDFSRIEAGRIEASYEPTDLAALTAELASVFRSAVERAGMRLVVECPPLPEPVYVDREMWEKVVLNLVSNAFKFTFEGEIEVALRQAGSDARLTVRDTGTGVAADELPRLFERFHRVKGAQGRSYEGSGIGLALVQELVKLHGGTVAVESAVGHGSTFSVTLPSGTAHLPQDRIQAARTLASTGVRADAFVEEAARWLPDEPSAAGGSAAPASAGRASDDLPSIGRPAGQRILIADDNADMRGYVHRLLDGYDVRAVADGEAALRAAQDRPPDLVLADVMMPGLDGFGLLRALRADPRTREVPVILLSARAGEESRIEGMRAGADDYLAKPFSGKGLLARVQAHLHLAVLRRESQVAVRESEVLHRVLSDLAAATHPLNDPAAIMATSARLLADHLGADRCAYAEVEDESVYVITGDATRGVRSIVGRWDIEAFGTQHLHTMRAGEPWVVDDAEADARLTAENLSAYRAAEIRAVVCVPLHKDGRLTTAMAVHQKTARPWKPAEIRLVTAVVGQCWEALERARIGRTLRESEEQFRTLVTATSDVVYQMSADWTEMRHLDGREFIASTVAPSGTWLQRYIPAEDQTRVTAVIEEALRERRVFEMEHRVVRVDGTVGWTFSRAIPVFDGSGELVSWFGAASDVTRRKEAEQELERVIEESERRKRLYEAILSATPDFVYVFSLDHRILYANAALVAMWGAGDPVGKTFLEVGYEPWHAEMHGREIDQVRATKVPIRGEVPFDGTSGRRIYDYIFVPVVGADGEVEAVAGTTRDVTERQAMEEEVRDADRRKDEFIALLAHELRNPLAPIRNGLQVMRLAEGNPAAMAEARGMMDRQLSHMVRLIDDLLDASRINRNKMELRRARVTLAEVVASAVETARPPIDQAGHELTVSLPAFPVHLDADLTRLAQLFSNLLTNSAKYTPPGGRIWLSAERKGGQVEVSVRDTGIGIPADSLGNIFDMFAQVDRSAERSTGGLGIGLALVKGLVEMHGGTVTASSGGEGMGSTFTVTLPVLADRAGAGAAERVALQAASGPRRRFLVVDDNRDGADSLAMMLRLMGHEVHTASDGIEAVAAAERLVPDVILMDIGMPRMNGLDATRRIREQPWGRAVSIVALTGWGQTGDKEESRAAGCDGHLIKPVNLPDLEKVLASVTT